MADLFENPMGLDGFEFVEFSGPDPQLFRDVFTTLGFKAVAKHRSKNAPAGLAVFARLNHTGSPVCGCSITGTSRDSMNKLPSSRHSSFSTPRSLTSRVKRFPSNFLLGS